MIVSRRPRWGRVLRNLGWPLLGLIFWDLLIVVAYQILHWTWVATSEIPLALYGSAIGIVVGFRNNSAYARWWEARALWGQIVNNSRSLARQVCAVRSDDPEATAMQRRIVYLQIAFVHALRQQLRGLDPVAPITGFMSQAELATIAGMKNVPLAIQRRMTAILRDAVNRNWISGWEWQQMDRTLCELMASQGGAERIKNTPLPKQYDFFPILFVQIYCLLLPVGMVQGLGWLTPLGSTLVGFMFLALDRIGRDLEDPFENTIHDLPLTAITRTIEINLRQMLDETEMPAPEEPVHGVLW